MEKRYQVFVSSTFADLQEERSSVFQTLMKMDCIPSGMELFPAIDEEQFKFIKKVIDDCDYYLLIIGGRYGSLTPEGISYTKKEYDYAKERGIKVIAFLHENPDEIAKGKSELDPVLSQKLQEFRTEVSQGRLVQFWKSASELPGLVALSLLQTIKTYPTEGWVRANKMPSDELLSEINDLRKRNAELEHEISEIRGRYSNTIKDIASFDDIFSVHGRYRFGEQYKSFRDWKVDISWRAIFGLLAPYLLQHPNDDYVKILLQKNLFEIFHHNEEDARYLQNVDNVNIHDQSYQTIKIQMITLGLVDVSYSQRINGQMALFWLLTPKGQAVMMEIRSVKANV